MTYVIKYQNGTTEKVNGYSASNAMNNRKKFSKVSTIHVLPAQQNQVSNININSFFEV